jgi:hypothetical protein
MQLFIRAVEEGIPVGGASIMSIISALDRADKCHVAEALFVCAFSRVCDLSLLVPTPRGSLDGPRNSNDVDASIFLAEGLQRLEDAVQTNARCMSG